MFNNGFDFTNCVNTRWFARYFKLYIYVLIDIGGVELIPTPLRHNLEFYESHASFAVPMLITLCPEATQLSYLPALHLLSVVTVVRSNLLHSSITCKLNDEKWYKI